jgi:hypothetical protein
MSGVITLAYAIPDMGALLSLDISSHNLARGKLKANSQEWGEGGNHEKDMSGKTLRLLMPLLQSKWPHA